MKRHATTIVLVLLAVVLGVALFLDRDKVTVDERKRRESSVLPAWRRDELTRIEVATPGETLVLARSGKDDAWAMKAPREERADQPAVERLLTTLEFASVVRKVADGAPTGLDAPRATGSVAMGGLVYRFALGAPSPQPEGSSYFQVAGEPAVVVSKDLATALLAPADTYRDRTVVPYLSLDLARFEVKHPGGGFALERVDERTFRVAGLGVAASRDALDGVWGALADMRAEAFPKDADADRLTANPRLTITMTPKEAGKPAAELVVGDPCPGHPEDVVVLRKAPTRVAACAPAGILDALRAAPAALADKRPFSTHADEIEELVLEWTGPDAGDAAARLGRGASAPNAIEIARKGTGFHERSPEARDLPADEADAASTLVTRIAKGEADTVAAGAGAPFAAVARARVRSGPREEAVEIGAPDGEGRVTLRRASDGAILGASLALARLLVPRATTLRSRTPFDEARRVARVTLRCGVAQDLVDRGEGLRLVEPPGYETDGTIIQLVDAVTRGKVDLWVSDVDAPAFGVHDDGCRAVVVYEDDRAPSTIWLGGEGEGGVYGRASDHEGVFVAPTSLLELAKRIYVSRATTRAPFDAIASVRVTRSGKAATDLAPGRMRELASTLFADRVIAIGPAAAAAPLRADLVVEMTLGEAGPPKRVTCEDRPLDGDDKERLCKVAGVAATFAVPRTEVEALLGRGGDAGAEAGAEAGAGGGAGAEAGGR